MKTAHRTLVRAPALAAALGLSSLAAPALAAPSDAPPPGRAFIRVELPKKQAYVGESIPVTIRAYYRADTGATLTGTPKLSDPSFTLRGRDPVEGRVTIGGQTYHVLTWADRLAPVTAGHHTIGIDLPSTLEWQDVVARRAPQPGASDAFGGDLFGDMLSGGGFGGGDPFQAMQRQMQQMMNQMADETAGPVQKRDVVLHAPAVTLDVKALPAAGRPAGFTNAVGQFTVTASADPTHVRAGEPITLSIKVAGEGGFDRVELAGLPSSDDWKTYAPSSSDGPNDKTFRQAVVPLRAGIAAIPAIRFSSFDPVAGKYVTVTTAPVPVDVAPGVAEAPDSNGKAPIASSGPTLAPNGVSAGPTVTTLRPLLVRPWFLRGGALALGAWALALGLIHAARRRPLDSGRPWRRRAEKRLRAERAAMERAMATGDSAAFFAAARGAIQERLGASWHLEPSAISLTEIEARLAPEDADELRPVFEADAARFSASGPLEAELAPWKQIVDRQLDHLERMEAP